MNCACQNQLQPHETMEGVCPPEPIEEEDEDAEWRDWPLEGGSG